MLPPNRILEDTLENLLVGFDFVFVVSALALVFI
jgi:hypothetical protein